MGILIKTGNVSDLPNEPIGWPQCGDFIIKENIKLSFMNSAKFNTLNFKLAILLISQFLYTRIF